MAAPVLVLASASPRRRRLLREWGFRVRIVPSRLPEPPPRREAPIRYARRLALAKALAVAQEWPQAWILGADTIVVHGRRIFGKPVSARAAIRMLRTLAGSRHRVVTAVALVHADTSQRHVAHTVSRVTMRALSAEELTRFAGRHRDKAGSYAIQDAQDPVVVRIEGSYTNVVGLPRELVVPMLRQVGISPRSGTTSSAAEPPSRSGVL